MLRFTALHDESGSMSARRAHVVMFSQLSLQAYRNCWKTRFYTDCAEKKQRSVAVRRSTPMTVAGDEK